MPDQSRISTPGQSYQKRERHEKVDLEVAILVDENIARFLIGMVESGLQREPDPSLTRSRWTTPAE